MHDTDILIRFYDALARGDAETATACYADDVTFTDPAFGTLHGEDARLMWRMLLTLGKGNLNVTYDSIEAVGGRGTARWIAEYAFQMTGRRVRNVIHARFEFSNGKIVRHIDDFSFHRWAWQAFGFPGLLIGWLPFMQKLFQKRSRALLEKYALGEAV